MPEYPDNLPDEERPTERFLPEGDPITFEEKREKIAAVIALKRRTYTELSPHTIAKPGPINSFLQEIIQEGVFLFGKGFDVIKLKEVLLQKGIATPVYPGKGIDILIRVQNGKIHARQQSALRIVERETNAVLFTEDGIYFLSEVSPGTESMQLVLSKTDYDQWKPQNRS